MSYLRLSVDDNDTQNESVSISGQRTQITNFINSRTEFDNAEIKEFCDDGYSGTNFNRPAVNKLFEDIKTGGIQCVIVKDLSRFGRNFIEVGNYIEQIFPMLGIRFIAINDNYDSNFIEEHNSMKFNAAFKNLMNECYARDISQKIRAIKTMQKERGDYIGYPAPYGYKLCNKKLEISEKEADVVKRIFELVNSGMKLKKIAELLNKENIPTRKNAYEWTFHHIRVIVKNPVYIGTLVTNKFKSIALHKHIMTDISEQYVFEDHHQPIISKDIFDNAQKKLRTMKEKAKSKNYYPELKNKVYCKNCGNILSRKFYDKTKTERSIYYLCRYQINDCCCNKKIFVEILRENLLKAISEHITEHNLNAAVKQSKTTIINEQISDIDSRIAILQQDKLNAYTAFKDGAVSKEQFIQTKSSITDEITALEKKKSLYTDDVNELSNQKSYNSNISDEELINKFVSAIYVTSENDFEITWRE